MAPLGRGCIHTCCLLSKSVDSCSNVHHKSTSSNHQSLCLHQKRRRMLWKMKMKNMGIPFVVAVGAVTQLMNFGSVVTYVRSGIMGNV